jgi:hypothetical protein
MVIGIKASFFYKFLIKFSISTRILHELEVFICKAFKGEAIVCYCEPLITKQMEASSLSAG